MSSHTSQPSQPSPQLKLVESLMQHIDDFQCGTANELTYLSAMNALRDLHAYVAKTEKAREATKKDSVIITIDGEEYFVENYQERCIAVRITDNHAYCSDTGDFVGLWNESTRTLENNPDEE